VCMSSQLSDPSSSCSTPSSVTGAATAAACFNQCESMRDETVDMELCADRQDTKSMEGCVDDDTQMVVDTGHSRQHTHNESAITNASTHEQQQYSRVEGRVQCTRPPSLVPSLKLPTDSPITLSTQYYWRAASLPASFSPSSTAVSNNHYNTSVSAPPRPSTPPPPCPVTLVASVVPHSPVWPEQFIRAQYQLEPCSKQYISFAPRLQAMPDIVMHKNCMSAMQKRLTVLQEVFPKLDAKRALQIVQSIMDRFTGTADTQQRSQRRMQN
jgi:hypothetical protein